MKKIILLFSILIVGCKSFTKVEYKSDYKKVSTRTLINEIKERKPDYNYLSIRSQSTIIDNTSTNQINLSVRIQKDEKILINGSILIPLFKALLTDKNIKFYEKISRTFYSGNYQYISNLLNNRFTLISFQNMLTGQPIIEFNEMNWKQFYENNTYGLETFSKTNSNNVRYIFNPSNLTLISQSIYSKNNYLTVEYDDYKFIEGDFFPEKITISANNKKEKLKILLNLKVSKTTQQGMFSFKIPNGYKEIKI